MRTSPFFARLHPFILARLTRGRNQTGPEQPFGTDSAPRCLIHRELAKISSPSKVLTKFLICSIFARLQRRPVTPGLHNVYVPGEQVDHQWCCNFCKRSSDVRKEKAILESFMEYTFYGAWICFLFCICMSSRSASSGFLVMLT